MEIEKKPTYSVRHQNGTKQWFYDFSVRSFPFAWGSCTVGGMAMARTPNTQQSYRFTPLTCRAYEKSCFYLGSNFKYTPTDFAPPPPLFYSGRNRKGSSMCSTTQIWRTKPKNNVSISICIFIYNYTPQIQRVCQLKCDRLQQGLTMLITNYVNLFSVDSMFIFD